MKRLLLSLALVTLIFAPLQGMAADKALKGNLRIVIGSKSTGGDTYQAASIVAPLLAEKLGINAKVDAVGFTAAVRALDQSGARGNTVMFFHDMAYLGNLYGVKGYEDIFANYIIGPTVTTNPGNAYLVPKKSPYKTIQDIIEACAKGTKIRVSIQPGGVSEIGFSAIKNAIKMKAPGMEQNLVAVNTGSQADKNQQLFDGQVEVIYGTVQGNEQYTRLPEDDQKAMRFIWLTSPEKTLAQANPEGMGDTSRDELLKFAEPTMQVAMDDSSNFKFDKEYFFLYHKDLDPKIIAAIDEALAEVYADGKIQETMKKSFFIPDFLPSKEAADYLKGKMERNKKIINAIK